MNKSESFNFFRPSVKFIAIFPGLSVQERFSGLAIINDY
ncbi:hypothetical protein SAMN05421740_11272 [Parapedobacter koreensis]|uniref:Uncharacterized protein n=1 Tax=Parapedobacter koreensis TaxID=332977 RepID=A0A1H7TT80_9SPHI|nr:hypothetical protein SAMN05421740_11272 [Parapedobacter koreensis]